MLFRNAALICALMLLLPTFETSTHYGTPSWTFGSTLALAGGESAADSEKKAFESAKELGTVEAWDAFLASYPNGFHADLARAYVKKLAGQGAPPVSAQTPAPAGAPSPAPAPSAATALAPAQELPCREAAQLRSQNSNTPSKIIFLNLSGRPRTIHWLDFNGNTKEFARINPGEQITQDTFMTHPWMALDTNGNCSELFLPGAGTTIARLEARNGSNASSPESEPSKKSESRSERKSERKTESKKSKNKYSPAAACHEVGMDYRNGQCVAKSKKDKDRNNANKNKPCPAGMYRNPLGQCQPNETGA